MNTIQYTKPNMTNMPRDIGRKIIKEILNSPVPDREKELEECNKIELMWVNDRKEKNDVRTKRDSSIEDILY